MRHRIYFPGELMVGSEIVVTGDEFHHAARVARLREQEAVELLDGRGTAVAGEVMAIERDQMRVRLTSLVPPRESHLDLTLAMAIIPLDKFELVLQKATELGVRAITPLISERIEVRAERYRGKAERWEKIVFEAVKQCGRSAIPRLDAPTEFASALQRPGVKIFFDPDAEISPRPETLDQATMFIGPAGGWSEREVAIARQAGCIVERLGPRRLRAETAAIAATGIITARYGDI